MKQVLSLLTIFVFLNVTSWAYAPDYSGSGTVQNLTGTYAGVLTPTAFTGQQASGGASLGIFAVGIPGTSSGTVISQGAGVLFVQGAGYNLTITGVFDPKTSQLSAILEGESNFQVILSSVVNGIITSTTFNIQAEGSLTGVIKTPTGKSSVSGPGSANAARITGTAFIDTFTTVSINGPNVTGTVDFSVNGFQQSSTYMVPTLSIPVAGS
jgi:hypothetical protein